MRAFPERRRKGTSRMTIDEYLTDHFAEVDARQFYRIMFPAGELDKEGAFTPGKYTGIVTRISSVKKANGRPKVYRYTLTDELDAVDTATACDDFCICRPLSYAGKSATADRARFCYAIAIDVDRIRTERERPLGLVNLWERHIEAVQRLPKPTAIVSSGTGLHLYYMLETPIALYKNVATELQDLKRELTRLVWHETIVDIKDAKEIQQEGIYQGFRMPGTITKRGGRARAYITGPKVSVDYLNGFIPELWKAKKAAKQKKRGKLTLAEAQRLYPEWYQSRIIEKRPAGVWDQNRNLYEWWKREILEGATVGHRYFCMMALAIFAQKCSYAGKHNPNPVTREELEKDCFALLEHMESLTESEDNHFDEGDILDALEAFDAKWVKYGRDRIAEKTAIYIQPNKRNGQKQADHLEEARAIRDIRSRRRGEAWDAHNGRKNKADTVREWRKDHPDGKKIDCSRETGIDYKTVRKWWEDKGDQAEGESLESE